MPSQEPSKTSQEMSIYINGSEYQPLKKIVGKDELLELADLDTQENDIYLLDEHGKKVEIDNDEGVQLQGGMRFLTQQKSQA